MLRKELRRAVDEEGYTVPTPIQEQAIPHVLAGRDLLGCAQTGTGKTAAFVLPLLQRIAENPCPVQPGKPRVLIMAPTRELAAQIDERLGAYGRHLRTRHAVIFGGVGQMPQVKALRAGADVVVATPGRLLDLMQQGHAGLDAVEFFVLDEADRMLDMGFLPDIRRIIARLPSARQSLFFSATLQPEVLALANTLVRDPARISVAPEQPTVERIAQVVRFVDQDNKGAAMTALLAEAGLTRALVFTRMKHGANRVAEKLSRAGIAAAAIHGNKSQNARNRALEDFKSGRVRILVATDIAARGIDVEGITHVINYDLPMEPETYVHRIGRTARAGASGSAVSFCSAAERPLLTAIERLIRKPIPVDARHPHHSAAAASATETQAAATSARGGRNARGATRAPFAPRANRGPGRGDRRPRRAR
ncbi:MAG: DEAD/DEAH box helicase [Lentisphaerae bacterium]|nr:DEAD/DEAH box helicase [Lentisphaerota bacterium]